MDRHEGTGSTDRIGLFDSGVGGLSILRQLQERCPNEALRFVYLADTGRCPYGDRSTNEINSFVEQIISWFNSAGVSKVVMACNTSAAVSGIRARELSLNPIYDLISSAAKYAASNFQRIGVIATSATCKSKAFSKAILEKNPAASVIEIPCPDLVPLVEQGLLSGKLVDQTIAKYTEQLNQFDIDSLIFGCTHFPFLQNAFAGQLSSGVTYIDPAVHLSNELFGLSAMAEKKEEQMQKFQKNTYFCTGDSEKFADAAELCLKLDAGTLRNSVCSLSVDELQKLGPKRNQDIKTTAVLKNPLFSQFASQ
ncbi:MAG: glutamate racemase [Candidatus Obscuribacterales bacterium]|nr:glutamate racemase [Candidatus Obscuribacterales bacterium]